MAQLARAYEATYQTYEQGLQDQSLQKWQKADANPNSTTGGSSGSTLFQQASLIVQSLPESPAPVVDNPGGTTSKGGGGGTTSGGSSKPGPTPSASWQYGISGNWDNPLLWSDAWAPYAFQSLSITGNVTVTIDSTTGDSGPTPTAITDLTIGSLASPSTILAIVDGGSLVVSGNLDVSLAPLRLSIRARQRSL